MFASIERPDTALFPLAASSLAWWSNRSFQSKYTPSHRTYFSGEMVLVIPSVSWNVMCGEQSYFGRRE